MGSQTKDSDPAPRGALKTFLDDLILTFSSPMAWLLMIALIITWSGVAIVLFDLLDYTTLAGCTVAERLSLSTLNKEIPEQHHMISLGLPPPSSIGKRGMKARAARPLKAAVAAVVTSEESPDWLQTLWSFVAGLVAPDEEEGIHQLTDHFTSFHSEEL